MHAPVVRRPEGEPLSRSCSGAGVHPADADLARRGSQLRLRVLVWEGVEQALSLDRIVFQSELATIGAFRCAREHPRFEDSGPIRQHCFVFPRSAVEIEHEHARPFVANPNVVTLYNRGQRYRRGAISREGDRCEWFALAPEIVRDALCAHDPAVVDRQDELFPVAHGASDAALYLAQRELFDLVSSGARIETLAVEECVIALLARVAELACGASAAAREPAPRSETTREVERILSERWHEDLGLADLAQSVGLSVFHLCRRFRSETGLTLHQYRHQLRLRASLEPVRESRLPLVEIALESGFSSHSHFTSAFRREFGTTPSRSRAQRRQETDS